MMAKDTPEPTEPAPPKHWMTPPLTDSPAPVADSSILAAVLALGESTDNLSTSVKESTKTRKSLLFFLAVVGVVCLGTAIYATVVYHQLAEARSQNHELLVNVESVTNPDAQAQSIKRADDRTNKTIACLETFSQNNHIQVDPNCPQPTQPIPGGTP